MEILRCQNEEQLQELAELANEIWHEYFIDLISLEQIEYMINRFQSYEAISKAMQEEHYVYFLAYDGDELIGYCGVKPDQERLFLSKLYLRKDKRGKGLSTRLLKQAVDYAKEQKKKALYLTCNKYNTHSLDVYHAKGFHDIDAVATDIGNGFIMDDYILQLDF